MLPFFGILTIAPLRQSSGASPSRQHSFNSIVRVSAIIWPPCLRISAGMSSNPAVLLFLRLLIVIFTSSMVISPVFSYWKLLLSHVCIKVIGGSRVWLSVSRKCSIHFVFCSSCTVRSLTVLSLIGTLVFILVPVNLMTMRQNTSCAPLPFSSNHSFLSIRHLSPELFHIFCLF